MHLRFVAAFALLVTTPAIAQNQNQPAPKASKADVQKVVDSIKNDKAKMDQYCALQKIHEQYGTLSEKDEKKAAELDKAEEQATKKLGADFGRIASSDIDDESVALFDALANSCPK